MGLINRRAIKRYVRDKTGIMGKAPFHWKPLRVSEEFLAELEARVRLVLHDAIAANGSWRRYTLKSDELLRAWTRPNLPL